MIAKVVRIFLVQFLLSTSVIANQKNFLFDELLSEASLEFNPPAEYSEISIVQNDLLPYEKALIASDKQVEIRYALRPLSRMTVAYEDPHSSAPEPNHMFTMMFTALIGNLSNGGNTPHREYTQEKAREKFNADWAALSIFDLEKAYSEKFSQAFLLAIHKNNLADAYIVIMFNENKLVKERLDAIMSSLKFR